MTLEKPKYQSNTPSNHNINKQRNELIIHSSQQMPISCSNGEKNCAFKVQLVLVLLLIGWKSGPRFVYVRGLHAVHFRNTWMRKILRTGRRPCPIWQFEEFFESTHYFQIGQACSPVIGSLYSDPFLSYLLSAKNVVKPVFGNLLKLSYISKLSLATGQTL